METSYFVIKDGQPFFNNNLISYTDILDITAYWATNNIPNSSEKQILGIVKDNLSKKINNIFLENGRLFVYSRKYGKISIMAPTKTFISEYLNRFIQKYNIDTSEYFSEILNIIKEHVFQLNEVISFQEFKQFLNNLENELYTVPNFIWSFKSDLNYLNERIADIINN